MLYRAECSLAHMNIYVHIYFIKLNIDKYYILINVYYV